MKKIYTKLTSALALLILFGLSQAHAQSDIDALLESGISDAEILLKGYVDPFMKGFGTGMANGWYNTAKAHKTAGFDLTITANMAYVPDKDLFYNVSNLGLQTVELDPSSPGFSTGQAPTIFGPAETPVYREIASGLPTGFTFDGPEGLAIKDETGIQAVPVPMAQLGIGIIKNTDIKIRWTPEIDLGDGTFKLIGFGIMHDFKQYIPGIKDLPFDMSVFVGYTSVKTEVALDPDPNIPNDTQNNQGIFDLRALTVQALISKKFSVLTLYGGLGFNRVRSDLNLNGNYDLNDNGVIEATLSEVNPIAMSFETGGPRLTTGMRLKLAIFTFHADYTVQKYDVLTLGFGLSIR
jgi:hypothetical protein